MRGSASRGRGRTVPRRRRRSARHRAERDGTLVATTGGGAVDSSASISIGEVAYGPTPYGILVREPVGGTTRDLVRGAAPLRFSFMNGSALPLFRAGP